MTGVYLRCDECFITIDAVEVTKHLKTSHAPNWNDGSYLRDAAKARGWTHKPPDTDLCPLCSIAKYWPPMLKVPQA